MSNNHTSLGDIFNEIVNVSPPLTYTSRVRIEFIGKAKVSAIRAVRSVTGLSLKSAKDVIEWPGGFAVSSFAYASIVEKYLEETSGINTHGSDWREISERPDAIEL
jgi:hypothetical protein